MLFCQKEVCSSFPLFEIKVFTHAIHNLIWCKHQGGSHTQDKKSVGVVLVKQHLCTCLEPQHTRVGWPVLFLCPLYLHHQRDLATHFQVGELEVRRLGLKLTTSGFEREFSTIAITHLYYMVLYIFSCGTLPSINHLCNLR